MSLREWIKQHRAEIDAVILRGRRHTESIVLNDEIRRGWVLNDESLYLRAKSEGVDV